MPEMYPSLPGESYAQLEDGQLFEAAKAGNHGCFAELFSRHNDRCIAIAIRILGNRDDALDVVQNACCLSFTKRSQCRDGSAFPYWLGKIVTNQALSMLRERKKWEELIAGRPMDEQTGRGWYFPRPTRTPEDHAANAEISTMLMKELNKTPVHLRAVLVLSDIHHVSNPDIAQRLQLPIPVVKARLFRARRLLRARLERHLGGMGISSLLSGKPYYPSPLPSHSIAPNCSA